MKPILFAALISLLGLGACNGSDQEAAQTDALGKTVDQSPEIDRDPTPQTGTGGEQQGTEPSQPAQE